MRSSQPVVFRAASYFAFGSAVSILNNIAPSQILLGLAVVALLRSGGPLRMRRVWIATAEKKEAAVG
ncbi:MAG TPA: hypothetical protein VK335_13355 [Bryobacteraceae bacterium]|nr:hypothetical protein [Bryobacteraceae bacterium]